MLFIGTASDRGVNYCLHCSQRRAPCDATFLTSDVSQAAPKPHAFDTGSHLSGYRVYQQLRLAHTRCSPTTADRFLRCLVGPRTSRGARSTVTKYFTSQSACVSFS